MATSYSAAVLAETSLQSLWKCDEASGNLTDSKGAVTATATSSPSYRQNAPLVGGAVFTNGSSSYFDAGNNYAFTTGSFSVEFWVKRTSNNRVISKYEESTYGGWHVGFNGGTSGSTLKLFAQRWYSGASTTDITGSTVLTNGVWYHVAFTHDNSTGTTKLYLNGALDATATLSTGALTAHGRGLKFGASNNAGSPTNYCSAYLNYIAIYNTALSGSAVLSHYNAWANNVPAARTAVASEVSIFTGTGTAGTFGAHYAFACTVILPDGKTLYSVARKASSHASYDGILVYKTSTDDGATWSAETTLIDESSGSWDWRDPYLTVLASGRLALTGGRRKTVGGFNQSKPPYLYSDDNGVTWKSASGAGTPYLLSDAESGLFSGTSGSVEGNVYGSDIVEKANGDLLLFGYGISSSGASTYELFVSKSTNGGSSWTALSKPAPPASYGGYNTVEPQVEKLSNGDLYMTFHTEDGLPTDFYRMKSTDSGATWATAGLVRAGDTANRQGLTAMANDAVVISVGQWASAGAADFFAYYESLDGEAVAVTPTTIAAYPVGGASFGALLWCMVTALGGTDSSQNVGFTYGAENGTQNKASVYWRQFTGTDGKGVYRRAANASTSATLAITRGPRAVRSVSTTATATRASAVSATRTVTATATATIARAAQATKTAAATAAATIARAISTVRAVTSTTAASIATVRVTLRTLTATATASVTRQAATVRTLTASSTTAATVARLRARLLTLAATATTTATLTASRLFQRTLSVVSTLTAAITQVFTRRSGYERPFTAPLDVQSVKSPLDVQAVTAPLDTISEAS